MQKMPNKKTKKFSSVVLYLEDLEKLAQIFSNTIEEDSRIFVTHGKDTYRLWKIEELQELRDAGIVRVLDFDIAVTGTAKSNIGVSSPNVEINDDTDKHAVSTFYQVSELLQSKRSRFFWLNIPYAYIVILFGFAVFGIPSIVLSSVSNLKSIATALAVLQWVIYSWVIFSGYMASKGKMNAVYIVPKEQVPNLWRQKNDSVRTALIVGIAVGLVLSAAAAVFTFANNLVVYQRGPVK